VRRFPDFGSKFERADAVGASVRAVELSCRLECARCDRLSLNELYRPTNDIASRFGERGNPHNESKAKPGCGLKGFVLRRWIPLILPSVVFLQNLAQALVRLKRSRCGRRFQSWFRRRHGVDDWLPPSVLHGGRNSGSRSSFGSIFRSRTPLLDAALPDSRLEKATKMSPRAVAG